MLQTRSTRGATAAAQNLFKPGYWRRARVRRGSNRLPDAYRPYLLVMLVVAASMCMVLAGDRYLLRYGFPWTSVSLIVVCGTAVIWGARPAILALACCALFGGVIAPALQIAYFYGDSAPWQVHLVRTMLFGSCGGAMIYLAHQSRVLREAADRKHAALQALQTMVAPEHLADADGWDVACHYRPAQAEEEVGGDFYDIFPVSRDGPTRYGIMIGDVMGKGKEAAANAAMVRYSLRALSGTGLGPAAIMEHVDKQIDAVPDDRTTSLFFGLLNADDGTLEYVSAGHEPPLLFHADGRVESIGSTGPILGMGVGASYNQDVIRMHPGDSLLLMTDGVTEARNRRGMFLEAAGAKRLFREAQIGSRTASPTPLASSGEEGKNSDAIVQRFTHALNRFTHGDNRDDIAILLLHRQPKSAIEARLPDERPQRRPMPPVAPAGRF